MRLVSIGMGSAINAQDLAELVDESVAILVGTPDEMRAIAPLLLDNDGLNVVRDIKPANVWLVKDDDHLYLNVGDDGRELWIHLQHNATRFSDRGVASEHVRKNRVSGARLLRLRTAGLASGDGS